MARRRRSHGYRIICRMRANEFVGYLADDLSRRKDRRRLIMRFPNLVFFFFFFKLFNFVYTGNIHFDRLTTFAFPLLPTNPFRSISSLSQFLPFLFYVRYVLRILLCETVTWENKKKNLLIEGVQGVEAKKLQKI